MFDPVQVVQRIFAVAGVLAGGVGAAVGLRAQRPAADGWTIAMVFVVLIAVGSTVAHWPTSAVTRGAGLIGGIAALAAGLCFRLGAPIGVVVGGMVLVACEAICLLRIPHP